MHTGIAIPFYKITKDIYDKGFLSKKFGIN
jgi:hypothetical protein